MLFHSVNYTSVHTMKDSNVAITGRISEGCGSCPRRIEIVRQNIDFYADSQNVQGKLNKVFFDLILCTERIA